MKQSWLIVTNVNKSYTLWDITKTVYAIGAKAERYAQQYEYELNEGRTMKQCVEQNKDFISVTAIPWSQAREYILDKAVMGINHAPEYKGVEHGV